MFGRLIRPPATPRPAPKTVLGKKGMTPSVLASDLHVLGNLIGDGIIDIDGQIDGNITCHTASIRTNACVRGDITAEIVHVYGAVEGVIKAKSVSLYATAKVVGIIMHESLTIEDGAFVDGKFKRTDKVIVEVNEADPTLTAKHTAGDVISFSSDYEDTVPESDEEVRILENLRLVRA